MKPLAGASALIFLNKTELDGCLDNEEISAVPGFPHQQCSLKPALIVAQILQLDAIETHEFRMIRCSAKENQGLQEGMEWVVDAIKTKNFLY
jgi:ADP-ribosylation factor-like protein 2